MNMSVTEKDIIKIAKLSRINIDKDKIPKYIKEISNILTIADSLREVDTTGVEPLITVSEFGLTPQEDRVTEGNNLEDVLANAPKKKFDYFVVPKVIE